MSRGSGRDVGTVGTIRTADDTASPKGGSANFGSRNQVTITVLSPTEAKAVSPAYLDGRAAGGDEVGAGGGVATTTPSRPSPGSLGGGASGASSGAGTPGGVGSGVGRRDRRDRRRRRGQRRGGLHASPSHESDVAAAAWWDRGAASSTAESPSAVAEGPGCTGSSSGVGSPGGGVGPGRLGVAVETPPTALLTALQSPGSARHGGAAGTAGGASSATNTSPSSILHGLVVGAGAAEGRAGGFTLTEAPHASGSSPEAGGPGALSTSMPTRHKKQLSLFGSHRALSIDTSIGSLGWGSLGVVTPAAGDGDAGPCTHEPLASLPRAPWCPVCVAAGIRAPLPLHRVAAASAISARGELAAEFRRLSALSPAGSVSPSFRLTAHNRHRKIYPYSHTAVRLRSGQYINASHLVGLMPDEEGEAEAGDGVRASPTPSVWRSDTLPETETGSGSTRHLATPLHNTGRAWGSASGGGAAAGAAWTRTPKVVTPAHLLRRPTPKAHEAGRINFCSRAASPLALMSPFADDPSPSSTPSAGPRTPAGAGAGAGAGGRRSRLSASLPAGGDAGGVYGGEGAGGGHGGDDSSARKAGGLATPLAAPGGSGHMTPAVRGGPMVERHFIAAMGPLPNTTPVFWRMAWEKRTTCLVMVTRCVEGSSKKCYRYWPTLDGTPVDEGAGVPGSVLAVEGLGDDPVLEVVPYRSLEDAVSACHSAGGGGDRRMGAGRGTWGPLRPAGPASPFLAAARVFDDAVATAGAARWGSCAHGDSVIVRHFVVRRGPLRRLVSTLSGDDTGSGGAGRASSSDGGGGASGHRSSSSVAGGAGCASPLSLTASHEDDAIVVTQVQVTAWPDHNAPACGPAALLAVRRLVNQRHSLGPLGPSSPPPPQLWLTTAAAATTTVGAVDAGSPASVSAETSPASRAPAATAEAVTSGTHIVVHCSAGVGRTGAYLAMEALASQVERGVRRLRRRQGAPETPTRHLKGVTVSVPEAVLRLRRCRTNMVTSEEQYAFVYKVLALLVSRLGQRA